MTQKPWFRVLQWLCFVAYPSFELGRAIAVDQIGGYAWDWSTWVLLVYIPIIVALNVAFDSQKPALLARGQEITKHEAAEFEAREKRIEGQHGQ